ncbi:MAG: dephospho-CoA kinase [Desulfobulbaceae bacterium]|nr:MAG: dephospho-CoA kinase [Desulfobulbaceae bacterium]
MIICITGRIGSGKSKVAELLSDLLSAPLLQSDQVSRELMEKGGEGYRQFVILTGEKYLGPGGEIDRGKLRDAVFRNKQLRKQLESIIHPLVRERIANVAQQHGAKKFMLVEVPLLYQVGWEDDFQAIIEVVADRPTCVSRTMERDGCSQQEAERIFDSQEHIKTGQETESIHIIDNNGAWIQTVERVKQLSLYLLEKTDTD